MIMEYNVRAAYTSQQQERPVSIAQARNMDWVREYLIRMQQQNSIVDAVHNVDMALITVGSLDLAERIARDFYEREFVDSVIVAVSAKISLVSV